MSQTQIGYLVALNENLEEDVSFPKLPLSKGTNTIGRNNVLVPDKRLSRKHITLTASPNGSAFLFVEGTNPVVVTSKGNRKKLHSQERERIFYGDIIELIPGHHLFKYVASAGEDMNSSRSNKRSPEKEAKLGGREKLSQKRPRNNSQDQASSTSLQNQVELDNRRCNKVESIRHFHIPEDKVPYTFRLLQVKGLPSWANTSSVSISDVIQGDVIVAILSNYMVDIDWLIPACPMLAKIPYVLVVHGEGDGKLDHMKRNMPANWILHKPLLPISFGTHHSKAMILVYPQGVRIIVHTANLIYVDWNNKSQGLWMQDFPWKGQDSQSKGCGFETDICDYLNALRWPEFSVKIPDRGNFSINASFFKKFDYSEAVVRLIASIPGYHKGNNIKKWGHMKLRSILEEYTFDKDFEKSPLVYQFSSLGSLDEKWMAELKFSMSSGFSEDKKPLGLGEPLIIWPSVEDVRCSLEGYAAGNAIPSPLKNVEKEFLRKYWAKWKASHTGRCRAMPHIKTFARYNGQKLAWFLLTSANLSKAAWGALQKNNSQLMIRSYELGVLFLPSSILKKGHRFSCTKSFAEPEFQVQGMCRLSRDSEVQRTKLVTLNCQDNQDEGSSSKIIQLPLPYELPPQRYSPEDVPWSWDRKYTKKDVYGQVWPRQVVL